MTDCVKRGEAALDQQKFDEAIKEFSTAISNFPRSVDYHLKRSAAYSRSSPPQYDAALKDANHAIRLAVDRAKRELISQAQLRRAILLFNMGQYADAEFVLGLVKKLDEKNKTLPIWQSKIDTKLKAVPEGDEKRKITVKEIPDEEEKEKETAPAPVSATKAPIQTPPSQIKHEFYQNRENVTFTLLAKGVPQDKAEIEIEDNSISISFPTLTGTGYHFSLDPLYAPIDPSASTYKITPTKVELVLKKKTPGQSWKTLEGSGAPAAAVATASEPAIKKAVLADKPPAYPTSSRKGPKNWDKVVDDITKKPKKADDPAAADEGDDDLEDHGGDEANYFFKKLFKGASPETQRAMMKSYQESNGTVLSTNWDEVSKGPVEMAPPDGMEAKKWSK
ncbi:sgt1 and cs domain containing protein [Venturia nashicola]|nr:sgt1 and cs domain containing protein [Venturia nashicola]